MTDDNPKDRASMHTSARAPDYEFLSVRQKDGVKEWRKEGGAFQHKNGCITTEFAGVKIVLSPIKSVPPEMPAKPPVSTPSVLMQGNPELIH